MTRISDELYSRGVKELTTAQAAEVFEVSARTFHVWVGSVGMEPAKPGGGRGNPTMWSVEQLEELAYRKRCLGLWTVGNVLEAASATEVTAEMLQQRVEEMQRSLKALKGLVDRIEI